MSRVRQELAVVQFQVQARQANASMDALSQRANELNKDIAEVQDKLDRKVELKLDDTQIRDYQKQLRKLNSDLNDVTRSQNELMKGVKAADKLWKAAATGTMEKLSVKEIIAGQRGMDVRSKNLNPGDEQDMKMLRLMNIAIEEGEVAVVKFRSEIDTLLKTISEGGEVSNNSVIKAKNGLLSILDIIPKGTDEWKQYKEQLQSIEGYVSKLSETERRLAGEVVTVDDALRKANATRKEAAEYDATLAQFEKDSAKRDRENAEAAAKTAEQNIETAEREIVTIKEKIDAQKKNVDSLQSLRDAHDAAEREADAAREAIKPLREEVKKFTDDAFEAANKVGELKAKLAKLNAEPAKPKVDMLEEKLKTEQELADAEKRLSDIKEAAKGPTEKLAKAEEDLRDKEEKENKAYEALEESRKHSNIVEEEEKLDALEKKHQELTETITNEKQVMEEKSALAKKFAGEETEASINLAQAQNQSEEAYEQALSVLQKAHKKTNEGTEEYNQQTEAIEKLKQKLAEMRGEVMSLADAEKLAAQAGTDGFYATPQMMNQATQAIERQREALIKSIRAKQDAGAATKEEEEELARLDKVLKDLKFEQDNFNMSHKQMNDILKEPKSAEDLEQLKAAIKRADGELKRMKGSLGENSEEYKVFATEVKEAKNVLKEMENQSKATVSQFDKAWSRLKTYVGMYMGFNMLWSKITGSMGDLMTLSDKMGEVMKTTSFAADEVGRLSNNLAKMDTRTPLQELMAISASAGQLGLKSEEDVLGFTEAANKMMVALPEMGKEAATEMMRVAIATGEVDKIRKEMEEGVIKGSSATAVAMEKIASTIDRLRASSASTAPEITDFVKRVGAVGAQSGITIDQIAALGSTVSSLGMRVEMSATALSRMIPAIKNNAFDIAKVIGVTPDTIRSLFEAGRGMEVIMMIFQRIKDQGMDEDSVEQMLGMGNMKEIMKELNQQGARAGIVFAGLSQNVDELRRQLNTAKEAYIENTAIQKEYDRMNETTAAKWERLKNIFEEMFVSDQGQRWLGGLIDRLTDLVKWIAEDGPIVKGLKIITAYIVALRMKLGETLVSGGAAFKNLTTALGAAIYNLGIFTRATAKARAEYSKMDAAMKANIWGAVIAALGAIVIKFIQWADAAAAAGKEAAKFEAELIKEQAKVENLTTSMGKARVSVEEANKEVAKARKNLEEAKKATDGSRESTERLTKAESDLVSAEEKKRNAMAESQRLIEKFNNDYSKYLGFMLSEVSSNLELAQARELVNDKLRETITLKRKEAALERVEKEYGEGRDDAYSAMFGAIQYTARTKDKNGKMVQDPTKAAKVLNEITKVAQNERLSREAFEKTVTEILKSNGVGIRGTSNMSKILDYFDEVVKVREKTKVVEQQFAGESKANREQSQKDLKRLYTTSIETYLNHQQDYTKATGEARKKAAAAMLKQMDSINEMVDNSSNYFDMTDKDEKKSYDTFIKNGDARLKGMNAQREKLLKEAGNAYKSREKAGGGTTTSITSNPWGTPPSAESTDYATWDVNELVARRNQMDKFKNILKPDTDVRAVLAEDKALMKALDNGLKADWKSVLNWYNQERLKIQQELKSERFSTNQGHWRDEKNGKGRKNQLLESDYALAELDRYYSRRKEMLEKAREEENMSEELFNRQADLLEQEHLKKRSDLRQTFTAGNTKAEKEMVAEFRKWWKTLSDSGDLDVVPWATVESEWNKATAAQIGQNNLKAQQDLTQLQQITVKHLNEIAKLIDKERPYDGITANLRKNLNEMDILLADLVKDGPMEDTAKLVKEESRRLSFLLTEAEHAYELTFEQLTEKMRKEGLGSWADELMVDEDKKQSLMQNLRNTYDAIQEAIKKESAIIKKQLDVQWNDILSGMDMSIKDTFEKAISDLGLAEDRVNRANQLIGAGQASERVADKIAIQQMKVQLSMQETYFNMMQKIGLERVKQLQISAAAHDREAKALKARAEQLRNEGKLEEAETAELNAQIKARQALQENFDAEHAQKSLNLAKTKEITEEEKLRVAIANKLEESQARLYRELKSWAETLTSGLKGVMEAVNFYNSSDYNQLAVTRAGGSYNKKTTQTTSVSTSSKTTDTGKHSTSTSASSTSTKTNKTDTSSASQASKTSYTDTNRDQSTNKSSTSDTHSTTNTSQSKTSTTTTEKIQNYYIIDNAGTKDAVAREVEMSEEEYYEKKIELDRDNAIKEAWKNLLDDLNMKMSETITDQINAMFQDVAINDNTSATLANTQALYDSIAAMQGRKGSSGDFSDASKLARNAEGMAVDENGEIVYPIAPTEGTEETPLGMKVPTQEDWEKAAEGYKGYVNSQVENLRTANEQMAEEGIESLNPKVLSEEKMEAINDQVIAMAQAKIDAQNKVAANKVSTDKQITSSETQTDTQVTKSSQSAFAKMIQAANLYGIAYQTMSNDNLNTTQKFQMFAVQAAGQAAISTLTAAMATSAGEIAARAPAWMSKFFSDLGPWAYPVIGATTALIGTMMGIATSKISKSKQEIAQATGASASATSVSAGKLMTGMLTYGEGNVNEFTDPSSLTPGRSYNVDSNDGRTYRAKYMGKDAKTHITNGAEFHLVGERGREAIIDAHTTRNIQMNEPEIWHAIQTLYNGGSLRHSVMRRKGKGVAAFADGNIGEFEMADGGGLMAEGLSAEQLLAFKESLDRNSAVMERIEANGIEAYVSPYGPRGIVNGYDTAKKEALSHGEKYL